MNELTEEALIRRFLTEFERHGPQVSFRQLCKKTWAQGLRPLVRGVPSF